MLHVLVPKGWPSYHWFTLTSVTPTSNVTSSTRLRTRKQWVCHDLLEASRRESCGRSMAVPLTSTIDLSFSDPFGRYFKTQNLMLLWETHWKTQPYRLCKLRLQPHMRCFLHPADHRLCRCQHRRTKGLSYGQTKTRRWATRFVASFIADFPGDWKKVLTVMSKMPSIYIIFIYRERERGIFNHIIYWVIYMFSCMSFTPKLQGALLASCWFMGEAVYVATRQQSSTVVPRNMGDEAIE